MRIFSQLFHGLFPFQLSSEKRDFLTKCVSGVNGLGLCDYHFGLAGQICTRMSGGALHGLCSSAAQRGAADQGPFLFHGGLRVVHWNSILVVFPFFVGARSMINGAGGAAVTTAGSGLRWR